MRQIKFKLFVLFAATAIVSCNNNKGNLTSAETRTEEEISSTPQNEEPELEEIITPEFPIDIEEDVPNKVKAYTIIGQEMLDDNTCVNYKVRTPQRYDEMDLYLILCYLKEVIKVPTKDYTIDYYTADQDMESQPYGVASAIDKKYTSKINDKETQKPVSIKREFVGKWDAGYGDKLTIYKHNGKYYIDYEVKGEMHNQPDELVKTTINGHVGFRYRYPDEYAEEYEIANGGLYTRYVGQSEGLFLKRVE